MESVTEVDFELPTGTLPKFTVDALTDKLPAVGAGLDVDVLAILVTAHPEVNRMPSMRNVVRQHARSATACALSWTLRRLIRYASLKVSIER